MILIAQHVRAPTGAEGINAFCRLQGQDERSDPPANDLAAGELVNRTIAVPPGGNSVRSYLDVIAPDETSTHEIRNAVVSFIDRSRGRSLPWVGTIGRCTFGSGSTPRSTRAGPKSFASCCSPR